MRDRFSADPTVVFVTAVLDEIAEGRLQIPRFQRPLVWRWEQRRDLLSSIYEGLPIGALMIWVSDNEPVERYNRLGPYVLPEPRAGADNRYIMDGVQRLSTLFGALRADGSWSEIDDETDEAVTDFTVYVDLDSNDDEDRFLREIDLAPLTLQNDPSRFLPLRSILDSRALLRFQRSVGEGREARIDVADEVAAAFRQYKVPLITLNSASLETVTRSFQRVNSRGSVMSEMHMINALTYSNEFDLLQQERELRQEFLSPVGWEKIDQDVILRALKLKLGVDFYKPKPEEMGRKLKADPKALEKVFSGLGAVARLLDMETGIVDPDLVPYKLQLIALTEIGSKNDVDALGQTLIDWFWMSTYTEAFGASARQSENAISDLKTYIETGVFRWSGRANPSVRSLQGRKLDFRSARGKALGLALARARDIAAARAGSDVLNRFQKDAFCSAALDQETKGRAGYRFVIPPAELPSFRAKLANDELTADERAEHLVSDAALTCLRSGEYVAFASQREEDIFSFERSDIFAPAFQRLGLGAALSASPLVSDAYIDPAD